MASLLRTLAAGAALVTAMAVQAAPITYLINESQGNASATGYITTDGVLGQVAGSDILDWHLLLTDGTNNDPMSPLGKFTLTKSNSGSFFQEPSYAFFATASELKFNFSGNSGGVAFQTPAIGSGGPFLAFDSAVCGTGWGCSSITWWPGGGHYFTLAESGTTPVAVAVPEPSSWALLIAGLGVLAWSSRQRSVCRAHA